MNSRNILIAVLSLSLCGQVQAQEASCPSALTLGMKAESATSSGAAQAVPTGAPVAASLHFVDRVFFAVPPRERAIARTYAGNFALDIAEGGSWRVALDAEAVIELVRDGARVAPIAEGVTAGCFVQQARYALTPGHYLLQLSASNSPVLSLLVEKTQQ